MRPVDLYQRAAVLGLDLRADGDRLLVFGRSCPPEFANELRAHKGELLDWLSQRRCPEWEALASADLLLNPVRPRPTSEVCEPAGFDSKTGVRGVRDARMPYLTADGSLVIPFDSPERFHWWKGGQSVASTLAEVKAWIVVAGGDQRVN